MGLQAVIFLAGFLVILGLYIVLIRRVSKRLSDNISGARFGRIERILILGIVVGVIAMFQPWLFKAYTVGFIVLLLSTLGFILWSHVLPTQEQYDSSE